MTYDKDALNNASKQKMFDDQFDPMALSLSENEKKKMVKGLQGAAADITQDESKLKPMDRRAKAKKKKTKQMGLWEKFLRWVIMFFTGAKKEEYEKKQRIKAVRSDLKHVRPMIYNVNKNLITSQFAMQVFNLLKAINPYSVVFRSIFGEGVVQEGEVDESQLDFQLFFLRMISTNDKVILADYFDDSAIKQMVDEDPEPKVRKQIDDIRHRFLAAFDDGEKLYLSKAYAAMKDFNDLLEFNFTSLLGRFNPGFSLEHKKPNFKDVRPEGMMRLIREFEEILVSQNLRIIPQLLDMAYNYFVQDLQSGMDPAMGDKLAKQMQAHSQESYSSLLSAIRQLLADNRITLMIKHLKKNPGYEPQVNTRSTKFFVELSRNLNAVVDERLSRYFQMKKEAIIKERLVKLFGNEDLPGDFVFSEETNRLLNRIKMPQFVHPMPFRLALLFLKEKYFMYMKRTLNRLQLEGSFKDSTVRRMVSDEFYHMDELAQKLDGFTQLVANKSEKGTQLIGMIRKFKNDLPSKRALTERINALNDHLHSILKDLHTTLYNLQLAMDSVYEDIGSKSPQTVENLRQINGPNNGRFIADAKKMHHDLHLFNDIFMQLFEND